MKFEIYISGSGHAFMKNVYDHGIFVLILYESRKENILIFQPYVSLITINSMQQQGVQVYKYLTLIFKILNWAIYLNVRSFISKVTCNYVETYSQDGELCIGGAHL